MLTLYNDFHIVRLPMARIYKRLGPQRLPRTVRMEELPLNAFLSFLDGKEEVGLTLLIGALVRLVIAVRVDDDLCCFNDKTGKEHTIKVREPPTIQLTCNDGATLTVSSVLLQYFTLLQDFASEYPGVPIPIPYDSDTVSRATRFYHDDLASCLECVKYLNPIDNTIYLSFLLGKMSVHEMKAIAANFTVDEREQLKAIHHQNGSRLLKSGEGHYILAGAVALDTSPTLRWILFCDQPNWILAKWIESQEVGGDFQVKRMDCVWLLETDFSEGEYHEYDLQTVGWKVQKYIYASLLLTVSWQEVGHLLAMIGLQSEELLNASLEVTPPCGIRPSCAYFPLTNELSTHLETLYPKKWNDAYYQDAIDLLYRLNDM